MQQKVFLTFLFVEIFIIFWQGLIITLLIISLFNLLYQFRSRREHFRQCQTKKKSLVFFERKKKKIKGKISCCYSTFEKKREYFMRLFKPFQKYPFARKQFCILLRLQHLLVYVKTKYWWAGWAFSKKWIGCNILKPETGLPKIPQIQLRIQIVFWYLFDRKIF